MDCLTPAGRLRNELNSHPALLDTLKLLLEKHYPVTIDYSIVEPFGNLGWGWNVRPTIQPKGGETT